MTKEEIQILIGEKISKMREAKGILQKDLAFKIGIEDSALRRIEKGRTNPTLYTLHLISEALEVSLSELVNLEE